MHCGSTSINSCGADAGPIVPKEAFCTSGSAATAAAVPLDSRGSAPADHHGRDRAWNVSDLLPRKILPPHVLHNTWDQPLLVRRCVKHLELGPAAHKEALQSMLDAEIGDIAARDRLELVRRQLDRCT
jgi:hypothetical protein